MTKKTKRRVGYLILVVLTEVRVEVDSVLRCRKTRERRKTEEEEREG